MTTILGFELTANISTLFRELPFLERPAAAAAAGFDLVECWWPFASPVPTTTEVDEFERALGDAGVGLAGLNFYGGNMDGGDRGVLCWPDSVDLFAQTTVVLAGIAERTGCRVFNALYGQLLPGFDLDLQASTAIANLRVAVDAVGSLGGTVVLEPLTQGTAGSYPLIRAADALAVVAQVPGTGLLFDTFHLTNNGDDLLAVIAKDGDRVGHVQVADSPGREQPGTGIIDFPAVFRALADSQYRGRIGVEYIPTIPTVDSLGWIEPLKAEVE